MELGERTTTQVSLKCRVELKLLGQGHYTAGLALIRLGTTQALRHVYGTPFLEVLGVHFNRGD